MPYDTYLLVSPIVFSPIIYKMIQNTYTKSLKRMEERKYEYGIIIDV